MGEVIYLGFRNKSAAFTAALDALPHYGERRFIDCNEDPEDRIAREYMELTDESFEITRRMCSLVQRQAQITERMSQLRIEHDEI